MFSIIVNQGISFFKNVAGTVILMIKIISIILGGR